MGCFLDEKYVDLSDRQSWDNDLQVDSSRNSQTEMHWKHSVRSTGPWKKRGRVMSLVLLITRHLFLWVKHRFTSFRTKAKGHNVAYFFWFMIRCQTISLRPLPSWLVRAGFCAGGQLAGIQHCSESCGVQNVCRWVGACLLNVLRVFGECSEGAVQLYVPNICMFGCVQQGERKEKIVFKIWVSRSLQSLWKSANAKLSTQIHFVVLVHFQKGK